MYTISKIINLLALSSTCWAAFAPHSNLNKRDDVSSCSAILVALKASAFCSSFVPIADVTSTATQAGPFVSTQITVTQGPCTTTAPGLTYSTSTTVTVTSGTSTVTVTTTTVSTPLNRKLRRATTPSTRSSSKSTSKSTATTKTPTTTATSAKCSGNGLPSQLSPFACDVIKAACKLFVKPKTVTVSSLGSGKTVTGTVTQPAVCTTVAGAGTTVTSTQTVTVVGATDTQTSTVTSTVAPQQTRQAQRACNNAAGPSSDLDTFDNGCSTSASGANNCRCAASPGSLNGGSGTCANEYYPDQPCSIDAQCPNGEHCLGYSNFDYSALQYFCTNTAGCA